MSTSAKLRKSCFHLGLTRHYVAFEFKNVKNNCVTAMSPDKSWYGNMRFTILQAQNICFI